MNFTLVKYLNVLGIEDGGVVSQGKFRRLVLVAILAGVGQAGEKED